MVTLSFNPTMVTASATTRLSVAQMEAYGCGVQIKASSLSSVYPHLITPKVLKFFYIWWVDKPTHLDDPIQRGIHYHMSTSQQTWTCTMARAVMLEKMIMMIVCCSGVQVTQ